MSASLKARARAKARSISPDARVQGMDRRGTFYAAAWDYGKLVHGGPTLIATADAPDANGAWAKLISALEGVK